MCAPQVRKGFWKPPPQIWLGDVSKLRVLDPHFLHQTAERLLKIPLRAKSKQVRGGGAGVIQGSRQRVSDRERTLHRAETVGFRSWLKRSLNIDRRWM